MVFSCPADEINEMNIQICSPRRTGFLRPWPTGICNPPRRRAWSALPARQHRALELGQDELLHLGGVIAVDQDLDPGLVLVRGAHRDQIDIGALRILAEDR